MTASWFVGFNMKLLQMAIKGIRRGSFKPLAFAELHNQFARHLPMEPGPSGRFRILKISCGASLKTGFLLEGRRLDTVSLTGTPNQCRKALEDLAPETFDQVIASDFVCGLDDPAGNIARLLELIRPTCSVFVLQSMNASPAGPDTWRAEAIDDDIHLTRNDHKLSIADQLDDSIVCQSRHRPDIARLRLQKPGMNQREINWNWQRGKHETMYFWSGIINNLTPEHQFNNRLDPDRLLIPQVAKWINTPRDTIRVLDVGSGPATNLGHKIPGKSVELTCIDLMANEFNELTSNAGLDIPCPPIYGTAEGVAEQFPKDHFDLVFSRNALDHVYDPITALKGMMQVCRDDGVVVVWGHINEGVNENYRNFHQWNFCWEHGDFIIWRPDFRQSVRELFDNKIHLAQYNQDKLYRIIMSKSPIRATRHKDKMPA